MYRWVCPDGGTQSDPVKLAEWAASHLAAAPRIYAHPRDLPALRSTLLAPRVDALPAAEGIVQPGTLWVGGA